MLAHLLSDDGLGWPRRGSQNPGTKPSIRNSSLTLDRRSEDNLEQGGQGPFLLKRNDFPGPVSKAKPFQTLQPVSNFEFLVSKSMMRFDRGRSD